MIALALSVLLGVATPSLPDDVMSGTATWYGNHTSQVNTYCFGGYKRTCTPYSSGERVWYALYQGSPVIPSGGLFARDWFEPRLETPPTMPVASVVGIDPADSGVGDETGIIGAMLDQDGTVVLTEDWSGQMTADVWARQAVILALTIGATP